MVSPQFATNPINEDDDNPLKRKMNRLVEWNQAKLENEYGIFERRILTLFLVLNMQGVCYPPCIPTRTRFLAFHPGFLDKVLRNGGPERIKDIKGNSERDTPIVEGWQVVGV